MGKDTGIKWTDSTFNPWWGCQRVSPGCEHCYAETFSKRVGLKIWGPGERRQFGDKHWREPLKWNAATKASGKRHLVFCASMADVFEDRRDLDAPRARLWALIRDTPHLTWLLLTKRPEHARRLWNDAHITNGAEFGTVPWAPNVWLGTTVEDQKRADERIPHLLRVPAAVRFLSCEPLLGPVDVAKWMWPTHWHWDGKYRTPEEALAAGAFAEKRRQALVMANSSFVNWVIGGGESGPGARPCDLAWLRALRDQCKAAGVPYFNKQLGAKPMVDGVPSRRERDLMGSGHFAQCFEIGDNSFEIYDAKGGVPEEWPTDLRVMEWPR